MAVHDLWFIGGGERVGSLPRDLQRLVDRQWSSPNSLREVFARNQFHHQRTLQHAWARRPDFG